MNTLILIDTSYTIFYRYYATLIWYSLAYKDEYKDYINKQDNNNISGGNIVISDKKNNNLILPIILKALNEIISVRLENLYFLLA